MADNHTDDKQEWHPPNIIPLDFETAIEGLLKVDPREPEQDDQPKEKKQAKKRKKK